MLTLLDRIRRNAEKRLALTPDIKPAELLANRKKFLRDEKHRLKIQHRGGAGGLEVCGAAANVVDLLIRSITESLNAQGTLPTGKNRWAIIAIGGYGRGELNPFSDIDIMFLCNGRIGKGRPSKELVALTDGVLYPLWDVGLKVGHSVRSLGDCVSVANSDMQSKTSLIEARLVVGDEALFAEAQDLILKKCVAGHEEEYIQARLKDQQDRRVKFGNSPLMQAPNIKNGCGGLRDFQNLIWMTFFKLKTRSLAELEKLGAISAGDVKTLERSYDYLMRVRNELHYTADRAVDVLHKSTQPTVASNLGYSNRSIVKRIEAFMKDYYINVRSVDLITRLVEQRLALAPMKRRLPTFRQVIESRQAAEPELKVDGFRISKGFIHGTPGLFKEKPRRLMRIFLHMQTRGIELHPNMVQHVRDAVPMIQHEFRMDTHVHRTFLEILNHPGNVAPILRSMHETGVLGKFIPEFGKLTCLVQHEFFHQYTADEHTLVCIGMLDRVWDAEDRPFADYKELFRNVEHPHVLYLALLLHDAGKAIPEKSHLDTGAKIALKICKWLGISKTQTQSIVTMVEQHLLLTSTSQKFDLEDPNVIEGVAAKLKTPENLTMLTLHSFADSLGTSATLWNDFKNTLLRQLHFKVMQSLTGETQFLEAGEKKRMRLMKEVVKLSPKTFSQEELDAHFENLPGRYVEIHSAKAILTDLSLVHRFLHLLADEKDGSPSPLSPLFSWHHELDRGYGSVKICTWNRKGFFALAAGAFAACGMSILSAQIFSRADGIIIDTFYVVNALNGKPPTKEQKSEFEALLGRALMEEVDFTTLIRKRSGTPLAYESLPGGAIPTSIRFNNRLSDENNIIEIVAEDNVGLLYFISEALSKQNLDIWLARISTEKGAAIDTFYVSQTEAGKIESEKKLTRIETALKKAIAKSMSDK